MNTESRNTRRYDRLGSLLRNKRILDEVSVKQVADQLGVKPSFVYLVEQGHRKPKDGHFGNWAEAYGIPYVDLWKSVDRIPMDLVGSFKEAPSPPDPFMTLTDLEKTKLLPFLSYTQWAMKQKTRH